MRVALVHDWLTGYRGGERVLKHLAIRFPEADLFTLLHVPGSVPPEIEARRIVTSSLNKLPGRARHYRKWLPLFPLAIRQFDFEGYDLVISTSHAVAKSVRIPPGVPHLDYCFTPMRYVWDHTEAYLGRGFHRRIATPLIHALRKFDTRTSTPENVTRFVAISQEIAGRIERHYGRTASIVSPPVDMRWIETATSPAEDFYLMVGGFVPYKREDLAIEAFRKLGRRLIIAGDGPDRPALEKTAPDCVEFVGRVDDATLASLYRRCRALIYPQHEDFGLIAVEAQAAGRPVIAYGRGGVVDTVRPFREEDIDQASYEATGLFFHEQHPDALCRAVERFEKIEHRFAPPVLRHWAERFSPERFDQQFDREIAAALAEVHAPFSEAHG